MCGNNEYLNFGNFLSKVELNFRKKNLRENSDLVYKLIFSLVQTFYLGYYIKKIFPEGMIDFYLSLKPITIFNVCLVFQVSQIIVYIYWILDWFRSKICFISNCFHLKMYSKNSLRQVVTRNKEM